MIRGLLSGGTKLISSPGKPTFSVAVVVAIEAKAQTRANNSKRFIWIFPLSATIGLDTSTMCWIRLIREQNALHEQVGDGL
jgi:hypothetical protein